MDGVNAPIVVLDCAIRRGEDAPHPSMLGEECCCSDVRIMLF